MIGITRYDNRPLPPNIQSITVQGQNIDWTIPGTLPASLKYISLNNVNLTIAGGFSDQMTTLRLTNVT